MLILEPEDFSQKALSRLHEKFEIDSGPFSREELLSKISGYEILMVRLSHHIDEELFSAAGKLKIVASPTTGLNHIDCSAAERRGIKVVSLRGEREFLDTISATAEHTWGLALALLRKIPAAHCSVTKGSWNRDLFKGRELSGRCLGIVGCGRLGSKVAAYGRAFGMKVIAHDPYVSVIQDIEFVPLEELFGKADVISVHAAYSQETHGLIGKEHFENCREEAVLINTARGEIIREEDLLEALQKGSLAGAALDVLCSENDLGAAFSNALIAYAREHNNLILTPHIGGATYESMRRTEEFIAEKILCMYL